MLRGLARVVPLGVVAAMVCAACGAAEEVTEAPRSDEPTSRVQTVGAPASTEHAERPRAFRAEVGLPGHEPRVADVRVALEPDWTLTGCLRGPEGECAAARAYPLDARDRATMREMLGELQRPRLCEPEAFAPGDPAYALRGADPDEGGDWVFEGHLPRDPDAVEGRLTGECREASRLAWWIAQRVVAHEDAPHAVTLEEPPEASVDDAEGFAAAYTAFSRLAREIHPNAVVSPRALEERVATLRFDQARLPGLHAFHAVRERRIVTRGYAHPGGAVVVVPPALSRALAAGHSVSGPAPELAPFLVAAGVDAAQTSHHRLSGPLRHLFHFGNVRICPVAREEERVLVRFELTVAGRAPRDSRRGVVPSLTSRVTLRFDPDDLATELVAVPNARCEDD